MLALRHRFKFVSESVSKMIFRIDEILDAKMRFLFDAAEVQTEELFRLSSLYMMANRRGQVGLGRDVSVKETLKPRADALSEASLLLSDVSHEEAQRIAAYYAWRFFVSQRVVRKDLQKKMIYGSRYWL
jgi:hypothetical protein